MGFLGRLACLAVAVVVTAGCGASASGRRSGAFTPRRAGDAGRRGVNRPGGGYRASVQLSENARALVLNGRPSRSRGQDCPLASMPLRTRRVPSAGINTVHTP